MITACTLSELQQALEGLQKPIGLVPTMGYLHEGHLSLVRRAKSDGTSVVVSIFVNPTQFGPNEDLDKYPRDEVRDLALLESEGADLVWLPTPEVMYPPGFQTWVTVEALTKPLEGALRPTHFRGVTTIVAKLFNAVGPDRAYFGQKDAQQVIVIRRMVTDLNFPIEIIVCPIVREPDGLAMSSRNKYLNPAEREASRVLYRSLEAARAAFLSGERNANKLREIVVEGITREPLARLQYVSCADTESLQELEGKVSRGLLSLAAYFGNTRLIDNVILDVRDTIINDRGC